MCVKVCFKSREILHDICVTNLLRHSEAHVRTELQHLLHLLRGGWNKRNIQGVLAVLHIMHLTVKLALVLVLQTFREKCEHAGVILRSIFCLSVWINPCILCQRQNILTNRLGRWGSNCRDLRDGRLHTLLPQCHPLKSPPGGTAFCLVEWPLQTEWCKSREYS